MALRLSALLLCLALTVGCAHNVAAPVPGQINAFDATSYRVLSDAQAAIDSVKADSAAGKVTLTEGQKKVFNQLVADYNVGESAWQSYHSGATNDTAGLTAAINQLVVDIAAIATSITGAK